MACGQQLEIRMHMSEGRTYCRSLRPTGEFRFSKIPRPTLHKVKWLKLARDVMIEERLDLASIAERNRPVMLLWRRGVIT
jgi:hypothetical protein